MELTPNLNLKKPGNEDNVNIDDFNDNADILDTAITGKVDKVAGKGLSTEDYTTTEKTKLAGISAGAQVNSVTSVAGKTGAVTLAKGDVGLGNLDNVQQAPISHVGTGGTAHAAATTSTAGFMSAADKSKIDGVASGAQVNRTIASQAQAESGTDNTTDMTPLRVSQAITALAPSAPVQSVAGRTGDVVVSKTDVGLGSVSNYGIASQAEAEAGTSSSKYMTPQRTKQAIDEQIGTGSRSMADGNLIIEADGDIQMRGTVMAPTRVVNGKLEYWDGEGWRVVGQRSNFPSELTFLSSNMTLSSSKQTLFTKTGGGILYRLYLYCNIGSAYGAISVELTIDGVTRTFYGSTYSGSGGTVVYDGIGDLQSVSSYNSAPVVFNNSLAVKVFVSGWGGSWILNTNSLWEIAELV